MGGGEDFGAPDDDPPPPDDRDDPGYQDYLREQDELERMPGPAAQRLPHNVEAEAALLGALMIDNRLVEEVTYLSSAHFFEPLHGRIYDKIRDLVLQDKCASPVTLRPYYEADEDMKEIGGPAYLAQLTGSGAAIIGARDFAMQVRDLALLRAIVGVAQGTIERALDTSADVAPMQVIAEMDAELSQIGAQEDRIPTVTLGKAWDELEQEFAEIEAGKAPAGFVIKLLNDWNAVVGRTEEGDVTMLGGRPSMGKTGLGLGVAVGAAAAGEPTEFLSLEMDRRKCARRALANLIYKPGVTSGYEDISLGKLTMYDKEAMREARKLIDSWPIHISDPAEFNVEDLVPFIRRRQRRLARQGKKLKLLVIDYLGRMGTVKVFKSDTEQTSYISRKIKAAAKITGIHIIVLVQLNRAVEQRDNKRPMLADLRGSGSLEQDADNVVFVHREEYFLERAEPDKGKPEKWNKWADEMAAVRDQMEVYSSKRREGPLRKMLMKFFTAHQAIRDHDFFGWAAHGSPIGPQDDDAPVPGFESNLDLPEARG
jgi:replicative DNA helicase